MVIGIFAILAGGSLASFGNFVPSADLNESVTLLKQQIRKARELSVEGHNNSNHGIFVDPANQRVVLYQGASYSSRQIAADSVTVFNSKATLTSSFEDNDLNFAKWSGMPVVEGTITLGFPSGGQGSIAINQLGVVTSN